MSEEFTLHLGNCLAGLAGVEAASVDAMVTDPPAGIGFMGREWDSNKGGRVSWIAWMESVMREALRVLKPGAHGLVWALPRTSHWTATALEQAGFEVRDVINHHFGTGFPKSLNVSKAIDEAAGAKREVLGSGEWARNRQPGRAMNPQGSGTRVVEDSRDVTAPATNAAKQWDGWGTALKPATEHWILVRKPLSGTVAANVQEHGTGALNIDACRIEGRPEAPGTTPATTNGNGETHGKMVRADYVVPEGRWPANLVLSHTEWCEDGACLPGCPVALLDAQSGPAQSGAMRASTIRRGTNQVYGKFTPGSPATAKEIEASAGGASRFFYVSKPTTEEREENVRDLPRRSAAELTSSPEDSARLASPRTGAGRTSKGRANIHPTVKSVTLMSWLITLVTPPDGLVLDPFTGSGTTGVTAIRLGHRFLGFEVDPDYHRIALAKLERARRGEQLEICA